MLKLKMSLVNTDLSENGNEDLTELSCNREVYYSLGEDEILVIGEFINKFMNAAGYGFNKNYIFLKSLDEDELIFLEDCLNDYRENKEKGNDKE